MKTKLIALISDSTGNLGERMILALASQYPKKSFRYRVYSFVRENNDLSAIFNTMAPATTIVFHTVLRTELKNYIDQECSKRKIPQLDLTGPAMTFLEKTSGIKPSYKPDRLHELDSTYEKRISALTYTVEHDDGLGLNTLAEADIVLLGVSRTSKTPTSIFLANQGFMVANIPLVKGFDITSKKSILKTLKVVGLVIDPRKLQDIRLKRADAENIPGQNYIDLRSIHDELRAARSLYDELKCPIIDVSNRAIEETAALILKELRLR